MWKPSFSLPWGHPAGSEDEFSKSTSDSLLVREMFRDQEVCRLAEKWVRCTWDEMEPIICECHLNPLALVLQVVRAHHPEDDRAPNQALVLVCADWISLPFVASCRRQLDALDLHMEVE